jgi:hypothetical protein
MFWSLAIEPPPHGHPDQRVVPLPGRYPRSGQRTTLETGASYQFLAGLEFDQMALPPTGAVVLNGDYSPVRANQVGVSVRVKL